MNRLVTQKSETAQWYALVNDAQFSAGLQFAEDVESYLVFMLMRYCNKPDMVTRILAVDYMKGQLSQGRCQSQRLQEVGDHCLILSGLFPMRAERLNVSVQYFVGLGQGAYQTLATAGGQGLESLYADLGQQFVALVRLLEAMRDLGPESGRWWSSGSLAGNLAH
ncbi:MAG TPA: hypothetical protein ENI80_02375 [Acidiferrobacteraceae bacterium]|nr:hypothetical protein [Acidiferrobacteraceae bacterium]